MLGAEHLLADRQRALDRAAAPPNRPPGHKNSGLPGPEGRHVPRSQLRPPFPLSQIARRCGVRARSAATTPDCYTVVRIDRRQRRDERAPCCFAGTLAPRRRNLPHQTVEADSVGRDRRIALVRDRFAVDQREGAQRRHGFVETVAGERRRQRLAEFFPRLGKQNSGIGSGASSAAWTISGSAAGWSLAASSMASAKVFATVSRS